MVPGDATRMSEVVGMRPNLYFTGSTSGTSLQECFKLDLKTVPKLPTSEKHEMMGSARVKDDSRSTSVRGRLVVEFMSLPFIWFVNFCHFQICPDCRLGPAWNGTNGLVSVGPSHLRGDHPPFSAKGGGDADCQLPVLDVTASGEPNAVSCCVHLV